MENFCPYNVIGLQRKKKPTETDINDAYLRMITKCHTDKGGEYEDAAKVIRANEILLDKSLRAIYDAKIKHGDIGGAWEAVKREETRRIKERQRKDEAEIMRKQHMKEQEAVARLKYQYSDDEVSILDDEVGPSIPGPAISIDQDLKQRQEAYRMLSERRQAEEVAKNRNAVEDAGMGPQQDHRVIIQDNDNVSEDNVPDMKARVEEEQEDKKSDMKDNNLQHSSASDMESIKILKAKLTCLEKEVEAGKADGRLFKAQLDEQAEFIKTQGHEIEKCNEIKNNCDGKIESLKAEFQKMKEEENLKTAGILEGGMKLKEEATKLFKAAQKLFQEAKKERCAAVKEREKGTVMRQAQADKVKSQKKKLQPEKRGGILDATVKRNRIPRSRSNEVRSKKGNLKKAPLHLATNRPEIFRCTFPNCDKEYTGGSSFRRHKATHKSDHSKACDRCGATFSRPDSLRRHQKSYCRATESFE